MKHSRIGMAICLVLLIAAVVFTGATSKADRTVTLVCDIWPPYQFKTEEGLTGFSVETVRAVYKRLGIPIDDIKSFPWNRALEMVQFGEATALFSANFTPDREMYTFYPEEVLVDSPWVIWTKDRDDIKTLEDLKGKTIGVVLGYSYTPEFWDFIETYCKVEKVHSDEINFTKLSFGRLDAIVAECGNGIYLTKKIGDPSIRPQPDITIKNEGLYIIFSRSSESKEFVEMFSTELRKFKKTEEFKALKKKYLELKN